MDAEASMREADSSRSLRSFLSRLGAVDYLSILIAYGLVLLLFGSTTQHFFSVGNLLNIGQYAAVIGIAGTAMTLVLISGHVDISLGSIMALSGMVVAFFTPDDPSNIGGLLFAMLMGIATGALCGAVNAFFINVVNIHPIVTTMATLNIFRGVAYLFSGGRSLPISNEAMGFIGRSRTLGIPNSMILWAFALVVFIVVAKYTVFGRKLFMIGGNPTAARLSGIKVKRRVFQIFVINGAMTALAGVVRVSQLGAALPQGSVGVEFQIISAVILGGASLAGGRGTMVGTLLGVLLLATLNNGMVLARIPSFWQLVVLGIVLILALTIDELRNKQVGVLSRIKRLIRSRIHRDT